MSIAHADVPGRQLRSCVMISLLILLMLAALSACSGESGSSSMPLVSGVTLSGSVTYEDREYGMAGLTGNTSSKPVRYALVEVVDSLSLLAVASTVTNATGNYTLTFSYRGGTNLYVRVIASTAASSSVAPTVRVNSTTGALYAVASSSISVSSGGTYAVSIPIATSSIASYAFNILDVLTTGGYYVNSLDGAFPPALSAYWSYNNSNGTQYCNGYQAGLCPRGAGMYILGSASDNDSQDDDVLWHEYGHFVLESLSRDDSSGGAHVLTDNDLDIRLAWSEGFAEYFPGAIKRWLEAVPARAALLSTAAGMINSVYVDTNSGGAYIAFDFGSPGGSPYYYSTSEVAVAKVLLDLDSAHSTTPLWSVLRGPMASSASSTSLESFWDGWLTLSAPYVSNVPALQSILAGRQIYYQEDVFEGAGDDAAPLVRPFAVNASEGHYLYKDSGAVDVDVLGFSATAGEVYSIETFCLTNGADTALRLLGPGLNVLATDDDTPNSATCGLNKFNYLASGILNYTIITSGVHYVEIKSSTALKSVSSTTGRYGSYRVRIVKQ